MKTDALCTAPKKHYRPARVEECGAPAFYIWTPRNNLSFHQVMCKECGEATAGNWFDELTPLNPAPVANNSREAVAERVIARVKGMTTEERFQVFVRAGVFREDGSLTPAYGGTPSPEPQPDK